jgi:hypothetical protein
MIKKSPLCKHKGCEHWLDDIHDGNHTCDIMKSRLKFIYLAVVSVVIETFNIVYLDKTEISLLYKILIFLAIFISLVIAMVLSTKDKVYGPQECDQFTGQRY